ncbi:baseplate assembly protein [Comamonas aquatica]|uniref:Baseplate J/gp47 family protein n=1 Tax=Comamonas aquatica TaxID=225991 RepID=A0AA42I1G7_9BURK|nr:baseplate J/gp47 family protein [Comamonas aquatica]MDH0364245.1 baseplate J/gp47 family protein [Comamonas aquatica]
MSVDLSQLPAPNVVQPLDFEAELARLKAIVREEMAAVEPEIDTILALESEPIVKVLQRIAYENIAMQARINDSAHACMLAYAVDEDLEVFAANNGVQKLPGETDEQLRRRAQMAFEGLTVAGSKGSYIFHALGADAHVLDAMPITPTGGTVRVVVLSTEGDGSASPELLDKVEAALSPDDVRPMSETVEVVSAEVIPFEVIAQLRAYPGPTQANVLERALASLNTYLASCRKLGYDVALTGIAAALHVQGVQSVVFDPAMGDVEVLPHQVAWCTAINVTLEAGSYV